MNRYSAKHIFAIVLTLFSVVTMTVLGMWQLSRMGEKEARLALIEEKQRAGTAELSGVLNQQQNIQDWPVTFTGRPDTNKIMLLDNRIVEGKTGYEVLVPVETNAGWVIVNAGWIKGHPDRTLPAVHYEGGLQTFSGTISVPGDNPMISETAKKGQAFPLVVQQIDTQKLSELTAYPLRHFVIQLDVDNNTPFVRRWQPVVMSPQKHLGYALQWFLLALAASVIGFIVVRRAVKDGQ